MLVEADILRLCVRESLDYMRERERERERDRETETERETERCLCETDRQRIVRKKLSSF